MACLVLVEELRRLEGAFHGGDISRDTLSQKSDLVLKALADTVAATERFDIVLPVLGPGQFSPSFWRWFNWWEDHFGRLTIQEMAGIESPRGQQRFAIRGRQPTAHWLNWRDTPAFSLKT